LSCFQAEPGNAQKLYPLKLALSGPLLGALRRLGAYAQTASLVLPIRSHIDRPSHWFVGKDAFLTSAPACAGNGPLGQCF